MQAAQSGYLFLDELSTSPPAVQAAMLGVALERRVGDLLLPRAVQVVAAANPPERAAECFGIVRKLLEDVQTNGAAEDEFRQAKTKVLSREVRAGERTQRRMLTVAKDWVYRGEYRSVDDELAAWDAVTMADVRAVLDRYPLTNQTVTAYGPLDRLG